ncbi:hypothetical protein CMV30_04550 [Nibricoccus aquaticus]|uniref:Nucleotide-diphospho-sugar transferase domain-containing protein n=1 Tax=Nibricoccus aquaticus TaxID=2576891 RepID=A0A290Q4D2_9BACT|nr:putative nucleotide-diphospho-sugar transferase [Nibricoccus aquaticus]ATC63283.1 hypothetical protein CMV30_04550 [Nibricoccus aquaticus]
MKTPARRGALYIVSGHPRYLEEAEFSARMLRKFNPGLPIAFASPSRKFKSRHADIFCQLDPLDHPLKYKPLGLLNSPFEETLFLDSDTQVKGDLTSLLALFDRADLAAAHDLLADWSVTPPRFLSYTDPDHFNTGVLLVRRTPATTALLTEWYDRTRAQDAAVMRPGIFCDQHWFNTLVLEEKAAQRHGVPLTTFDNRLYNVRPQMVDPMTAEGIFDAARILHFRGNSQKRPLLRRILSSLKKTLTRS